MRVSAGLDLSLSAEARVFALMEHAPRFFICGFCAGLPVAGH
jgi:hypothetical protein